MKVQRTGDRTGLIPALCLKLPPALRLHFYDRCDRYRGDGNGSFGWPVFEGRIGYAAGTC